MDKLSTFLVLALPAGDNGDAACFEVLMLGQLLQCFFLFENS